MNERIKQLAEQATTIVDMVGPQGYTSSYANFDREKFAELIVKECAKVAWYHTPDTEELEYSHLLEDKSVKHVGGK